MTLLTTRSFEFMLLRVLYQFRNIYVLTVKVFVSILFSSNLSNFGCLVLVLIGQKRDNFPRAEKFKMFGDNSRAEVTDSVGWTRLNNRFKWRYSSNWNFYVTKNSFKFSGKYLRWLVLYLHTHRQHFNVLSSSRWCNRNGI